MIFEPRPYQTEFIEAVLESPLASYTGCVTDWNGKNFLLFGDRSSGVPIPPFRSAERKSGCGIVPTGLANCVEVGRKSVA